MNLLNNKCKLIYICENDLTQQIGGTIHVKEVLASLAKLHHDIILIAPDYHGKKIAVDHNVKTIFIKTWNITIIKWFYFYIASTFSVLRLFLKSPKLIIYSREMSYNIFLPILTKLLHIPLFIEINSILVNEAKEMQRNNVELILTKFMQRIIYRLSTEIVAVSKTIANNLIKQFHVPSNIIKVIYNGVSVKNDKSDKIININKIFNVKSPFCIGFIGSCYPTHDLGLMIQISPKLVKQYPNMRFIIAGDGSMLNEWKNQVKKLNLDSFFYFPGYIGLSDVSSYIRSFQVCLAINKKKRNGPGMKIFEYLYYNKPVVASYLSESYELFKDLSNVLWVRSENPEDLYNTISKTYTNYHLYSGIDSNSFIISNFTWDNTARNIFNTIQETLCAA